MFEAKNLFRQPTFKMKNILKQAAAGLLAVGAVPLSWDKNDNFGDKLNPLLVSILAGKRVSRVPYGYGRSYFAIGSILHRADHRSMIWGSGFIQPDSSCAGPPSHIFAVRGPLTAGVLRRSGIPCADVFGDPAILLPKIFNPPIRKHFRLGIIPHYVDKQARMLNYYAEQDDVLIIDIQDEVPSFIRKVLSCNCIASSSLHGLIAAEAYGIPSTRLILSDEVIGGSFKFRDYRLGLGATEHVTLEVDERPPSVDTIIDSATLFSVDRLQSQLMMSCPFRTMS